MNPPGGLLLFPFLIRKDFSPPVRNPAGKEKFQLERKFSAFTFLRLFYLSSLQQTHSERTSSCDYLDMGFYYDSCWCRSLLHFLSFFSLPISSRARSEPNVPFSLQVYR